MAANCETMARGKCGTTPGAGGGANGAGDWRVRRADHNNVESVPTEGLWVREWWNSNKRQTSVIASGLSPSVRRLPMSATVCQNLPRTATSPGLHGGRSKRGVEPIGTSRRVEVDDWSAVVALIRRAANFHPIKPG